MPPERRNAGYVPTFFLRRAGGLSAPAQVNEQRFGASAIASAHCGNSLKASDEASDGTKRSQFCALIVNTAVR